MFHRGIVGAKLKQGSKTKNKDPLPPLAPSPPADPIQIDLNRSIQNHKYAYIDEILVKGSYLIYKFQSQLKNILEIFYEVAYNMGSDDDLSKEAAMKTEMILIENNKFIQEFEDFLKRISELTNRVFPPHTEEYFGQKTIDFQIDSYISLIDQTFFRTDHTFIKTHFAYLDDLPTLFTYGINDTFSKIEYRITYLLFYTSYRHQIGFFCPKIYCVNYPEYAFLEFVAITNVLGLIKENMPPMIEIKTTQYDFLMNNLIKDEIGFAFLNEDEKICFEPKVKGNSSDGFIISYKMTNEIRNLYVKQFYIESISFRNQLGCTDIRRPVRDLDEAEEYTKTTLKESSNSLNEIRPPMPTKVHEEQIKKPFLPVVSFDATSLEKKEDLEMEKSKKLSILPKIPDLQPEEPETEDYFPFKCSLSTQSSENISKNKFQMTMTVEFFGYFLLKYLDMTPDYVVIESKVYQQPLIVMCEISEDYIFIKDLKTTELYQHYLTNNCLIELCTNFTLLRIIHYLFYIDDFNEENVAVKDGKLQIVDLWTSLYPIIKLFDIPSQTKNYHSYQATAINEILKYTTASIIKGDLRINHNKVSDEHNKLMISYLTYKALSIFQSKEKIEDYDNWMKNNTLIHYELFIDLFNRSKDYITQQEIGEYFRDEIYQDEYIDKLKNVCANLFKDLALYLIETIYPSSLHADHDEFITELKKHVVTYISGKRVDIFDEFFERHNISNEGQTMKKVLLTFSLQEIGPEMFKYYDDQWFIFTNNFFIYDMIYMYLKKYGAGQQRISEPIFKGGYSSLFIYTRNITI